MIVSCDALDKCILVACDDLLAAEIRSDLAGQGLCFHHERTFHGAEEQLEQRYFCLVMVEISFDGARIFELLRLIKQGKNCSAPIVCFRGREPLIGRYGDMAIASAVDALARARYLDLSLVGFQRSTEFRSVLDKALNGTAH
jgi:hypothetical protein